MGLPFGAFGRPNRAKFGVKRVLNAYFLQKVDFQKNERRVGHSTILTPRRHPRRAKIAPRRLQDLPKTILKSVFSLLKIAFDFDSFWDRFWLHFGSPNASLLAPFSHQNRSKNRCEIGLLQKSLQDRPKSAQDPPKTPPGPPRSDPERGNVLLLRVARMFFSETCFPLGCGAHFG